MDGEKREPEVSIEFIWGSYGHLDPMAFQIIATGWLSKRTEQKSAIFCHPRKKTYIKGPLYP